MNGKPQEARADEQEDLLDQIITQGLDRMKPPSQMESPQDAPSDDGANPAHEKADSPNAAPRADRRHRTSAVYLYLVILFGAAFLMLLLAYFIQQRSSEDAISGLRDSMNLSRQQLLDEIQELEDKNAELEGQNIWLEDGYNRLIGELSDWQERYEEQVQLADGLREQYYAARQSSYAWQTFWILEQSYQSGDYESCAALLLLIAQGEYAYFHTAPDSDRDLFVEIAQAVIDEGILDENYRAHISDYEGLIDSYLDEHNEVTILYG